MTNILILYYSRHGHIEMLANSIAQGVNQVDGCEPKLATIPDIQAINSNQDDYKSLLLLLKSCDGLIMGAPAYFGGMPASVKHFWDQSSSVWLNGHLVNKPAAVFGSSSTQHGGHETILLNAMLPLLHHGMLIVGNSYLENSLNETKFGGAPYGAGHVELNNNEDKLDIDEDALAVSLGKRVARLAKIIS